MHAASAWHDFGQAGQAGQACEPWERQAMVDSLIAAKPVDYKVRYAWYHGPRFEELAPCGPHWEV